MRSTAFTRPGDEIRWAELPGRRRGARGLAASEPPTRVYLHGLGWTGSATFARVVASVPLSGARSLLVDLPGHGASDRPTDFGYTLHEHAEAVAALLDAEHLTGVDLIGHSLGGSIAIVLASRRPDLVAQVAVIEANLDPLVPSPTGLGSQRISTFTESAWLSGGCAEFIASNPSWAPTLRQCDPLAIYRSAVGLITGTRPTVRELLTSLPIPRTFIRGSRGEPLKDCAALQASGVGVLEVPDAGHFVMLDQPDRFAVVVAGLLGSAAVGPH